MYDVKSRVATEFIDNKEILDTIAYAKQNKSNRKLIEQLIHRAKDCKGLTHREAAVLLECDQADLNEQMFHLAKQIKQKLYKKDKCGEYKIPLNIIKVGIHTKGQVSDIYNLDDLDNNIIVNKVIGPQKEEEYTLRFWISKNTLTQEADMHFHGIIEVVEDGNDVAKAN